MVTLLVEVAARTGWFTTLWIETSTDKDIYFFISSKIKPRPCLLDQVGSDPTPLTWCIEADSLKFAFQCFSHCNAFIWFISFYEAME